MVESGFGWRCSEDLGKEELARVGECFAKLAVGELKGGLAFRRSERVREGDEVTLERDQVAEGEAVGWRRRVPQRGERGRSERGQLVESGGEHVHL
eukprot:2791071-Pleurochrysis_carterae.AAC.2